MHIIYFLQAITGLYDSTQTRIVAAWPTLEQAEAHRAAAQAEVDSLIARANAGKEHNECYLSEVTNQDLDLTVFDGYCRYFIQPALMAEPGESPGNLLKHGALLGEAQAAVEQNRLRYDKTYAKLMAQRQASSEASQSTQQTTGTFADKLQQAIRG